MLDFWEVAKASFTGAMAALMIIGLGTAVVVLLVSRDKAKPSDPDDTGEHVVGKETW